MNCLLILLSFGMLKIQAHFTAFSQLVIIIKIKKKPSFESFFNIMILRQTCKPSSVKNGHLSTPAVTSRLQRLHGARRAAA